MKRATRLPLLGRARLFRLRALNGLATMLPLNSVEDSDEWLERVRFATKDTYISGLRRLLMMDAGDAERMAVHASEMGLEILGTDGLWRFYVEDPEHRRGILLAELFDADGFKVGVASVQQYKGEIHRIKDASDFVLTSDYHGRRLVAILRGLSENTLSKLRDALPGTEFSYGWDPDEEDQKTTVMADAEHDGGRISSLASKTYAAFLAKPMLQPERSCSRVRGRPQSKPSHQIGAREPLSAERDCNCSVFVSRSASQPERRPLPGTDAQSPPWNRCWSSRSTRGP